MQQRVIPFHRRKTIHAMAKSFQENTFKIVFLMCSLFSVIYTEKSTPVTSLITTTGAQNQTLTDSRPWPQESVTDLSEPSTRNTEKTITTTPFNSTDLCNSSTKSRVFPEPDSTFSESSTSSSFFLQDTTGETISSFNSTPLQGNSSSNESSSFPRIISVFAVIVGFAVIMINILVIAASVRNRKLRENTNYNLVLGLSSSDFLMGLSMLMIGFRLLFPTLTTMLGWCIVVNVVFISSLIMSLYQTFCISLHRYLVLSESSWAGRLFDDNRKYYLYIGGWMTFFILYSSTVSPEGDYTHCFYKTVYGQHILVVRFTICVFGIIFLLLTLIFYFLAIHRVIKRYTNMTLPSDSRKLEDKRNKRILKSMKLVSMILAALFLFSSPMIVSLMFSSSPQSVIVSSFAAANLNSLLNPIIYCSRIKKLRNEIKSMFCFS